MNKESEYSKLTKLAIYTVAVHSVENVQVQLKYLVHDQTRVLHRTTTFCDIIFYWLDRIQKFNNLQWLGGFMTKERRFLIKVWHPEAIFPINKGKS